MSPPHPHAERAGPVVARQAVDGRVSRAVVETLATLPEFDETAGTSLYDYVDPDALDELFSTTERGSDREGSVAFPVREYTVLVDPDGDVVVRADSPANQ